MVEWLLLARFRGLVARISALAATAAARFLVGFSGWSLGMGVEELDSGRSSLRLLEDFMMLKFVWGSRNLLLLFVFDFGTGACVVVFRAERRMAPANADPSHPRRGAWPVVRLLRLKAGAAGVQRRLGRHVRLGVPFELSSTLFKGSRRIQLAF